MLLSIVLCGALGYLARTGYYAATVEVPKRGGVYAEAVLGQPAYFNPLLARTSADYGADAEASVVQLVYSGLMRADGKGGVVPDLAERYDVSGDGLTYTFVLREGVLWHDGTPLTAADVEFTFRLIQDQRYMILPSLSAAWRDVTVDRVDDRTVRFTLKKPYVSFVGAQLRTGILPKHMWESVGPDAFVTSKNNLRPIGSGPYRLQDLQTGADDTVTGVTLGRFKDYYGTMPFIDRINLSFYADEDAMIGAYQSHKVQGVAAGARDTAAIAAEQGMHVRRIGMPSTYAVFLNPLKSAALAYADVRTALAMATDRGAMVAAVFGDAAVPTSGPFVDGMAWHEDAGWPGFDAAAARDLLEKNGWKAGQDGIRAREGTVLRFSVVVPAWPDLVATAGILRDQWRAVGADVTVVTPDANDFFKVVRERDYTALLYGQTSYAFDADPFAFWHSSQKDAPGLNFSQFANKDVDQILTDAQTERDGGKRDELHRKFAESMVKNMPAVFLYSPLYLYVQSDRVGGNATERITVPAERFATVAEWYVQTRRAFK